MQKPRTKRGNYWWSTFQTKDHSVDIFQSSLLVSTFTCSYLPSDFPPLLHGHSPLIHCRKSINSIKLFHHEGTPSAFENHAERHHSDVESIELLWATMSYYELVWDLWATCIIRFAKGCRSCTHLVVTCRRAARRKHGQVSMQILDLDGRVAGREQWLQAVVSVPLVPVCWRPGTWDGNKRTYANLRRLSICFAIVSCHFINFISFVLVLQKHHRACDLPDLVMPCQAMAYDPKRDEIYYAFRSSTVKESINRFKRTDGSQGVDTDTAVYSGVFYEWLDGSKTSNSVDGFITSICSIVLRWINMHLMFWACSELCSISTTIPRLLPVSNVINSFLLSDAPCILSNSCRLIIYNTLSQKIRVESSRLQTPSNSMSSLEKFMAGVGEESSLQSLLYVRPHACHCRACTCYTALRFPPRADKGAAYIAGIAIDSLNEFIYVSHLHWEPHFHSSKLWPSNSFMEPPISAWKKIDLNKLGKVANYYGNSAQQSLAMLPLPEHPKYPGQGRKPWFLYVFTIVFFPVDFCFIQFWEPEMRNATADEWKKED